MEQGGRRASLKHQISFSDWQLTFFVFPLLGIFLWELRHDIWGWSQLWFLQWNSSAILLVPWENVMWVGFAVAVSTNTQLTAEVNCIGRSHCLISSKADFVCLVWVCFSVIVLSMDGVSAGLPQLPNSVPPSLWIPSSWEEGFSAFLLLWDCLPKVLVLGGLPGSTKAETTRCVHTGHWGWAGGGNNFWLDLHWHMYNVLIQIIVYSTAPAPSIFSQEAWVVCRVWVPKRSFVSLGTEADVLG